MAELFANRGNPDLMPHSAASDLGLHCFTVNPFRRLQIKMGLNHVAYCTHKKMSSRWADYWDDEFRVIVEIQSNFSGFETMEICCLCSSHWSFTLYSWLSLSRPRLSRITAYLEVKIWSLPIHENLTTDGKYCRKEEKLLLRSNFSSFPQYFQYISNFKSPITYQFVKCG